MKTISWIIVVLLIAVVVVSLILGYAARRNTLCERFVLRPPPGATAEDIARCVEMLRERIKAFGAEYRLNYGKVKPADDGTIRLSLYSFKGTGEMAQRLARRSALELRIAKAAPDPPGEPPDGFVLLYQIERRYNLSDLNEIIETPRPFYVKSEPEMVCTSFDAIHYRTTGLAAKPEVEIEFLPEDGAKFAQVTAAHIGEKLALVIDGEVRAAPEIRSAVKDGRAMISGLGVRLEARPLADLLRIGALPFELSIERIHQGE